MARRGRHELVATLIRKLTLDLANRCGGQTLVTITTTIDSETHRSTRETLADITTDTELDEPLVLPKFLTGLNDYFKVIGLFQAFAAASELRMDFQDDLAGLLDNPDADAVHEQLTEDVLEEVEKVVNPAIAARPNVGQQSYLLEQFDEDIKKFLDRLRAGELTEDSAMTLITSRTAWLLCALRVDPAALEYLPRREDVIFPLLHAIVREAQQPADDLERKIMAQPGGTPAQPALATAPSNEPTTPANIGTTTLRVVPQPAAA